MIEDQRVKRLQVGLLPLLAGGVLVAACGASGGAQSTRTSGDYAAADSQTAYAGGAAYGGEAATRTAVAPTMAPPPPAEPEPVSGEQYEQTQESGFVETRQDNYATFSLDVDTASYTLMRRDLRAGRLPRPESVRVEEYVNFFRYSDTPTQSADGAPFTVSLEAAPSPFGQGLGLLRVGVQATEVPADSRPSANLVFLVDVSGSMNTPDKLGYVQHALSTLVDTLRPDDTIGIVVYAGSDAVLVEPTPVVHRGMLLSTIENLSAGGSTHGAAGIRTAYDLASQYFRRGGINRVILCTDGDFNVGITGDELVDEVARQRERGIALTVLGFGSGNLNDRFMEQLTNRGNGNYAYIDNRNEAMRVLGRDLGGTLQIVAKDVKVQVVFDPTLVRRFRLVGYDNRRLAHEDFTDDTVDATEIGSGQFTTAYFEYELAPGADPAQAQQALAEIRLRYKQPEGTQSRQVVYEMDARRIHADFAQASAVFRFGAAVAEFGEILRRSQHSEGARFEHVLGIARAATWSQSDDTQEFLELVATADRLWRQQ